MSEEEPRKRMVKLPTGGDPAGRKQGVKMKTAGDKSMSSQQWIKRQISDPYSEKARAEGWRSRAAFKLAEIDDKFHLIRRGSKVIDLGAAPGGWVQVALKRGAGAVVGVDLLEIEPIPGSTLIQADFTEPFVAWEGIEAEMRGEPFRTFAYTDYGFPDAYSVLLMANSPWLAAHPDQATAFVQAAQRGYQMGADDPGRAARLLMDANPGTFTEPTLVTRSQDMLAARYLKDGSGKVGPQTAGTWTGYSGFVFDTGTLAGPDGTPLTARPDFSTWFTNAHLST